MAAVIGYIAAAALGLALAFPGTNASPFWPPTALGIALLYRYGLRLWPAILIAAFAINLMFMLRAAVPLAPAMLASVGVGAGNMLEAWVGVWLLRGIARDQFPFDGARGVSAFFLAACSAPVVSATIGVTASRWVSLGGAASYAQNWLTWWVGDTSGALTMAPILMLSLQARWHKPTRWRLLEGGALLITLVVGTAVALGWWHIYGEHRFSLIFMLLPIILWAVLRFQIAGAASAVFLIASIAVLASIGGDGPFARPDVNESLLVLQLFIIVLASTTLSLGTVLSERDRLVRSLATTNAVLNKLAFNDALTGLPNRRALLDRVQQAERSARRRQKRAALLFLDLDRFKRINDSLGHDVGDELLKTVAQRLRGTLREEDSVCRLGGDEFVVLLGDIDEVNDAVIVAQKIIQVLQAPVRLGKLDLGTSTSIGISIIPDDGSRAEDLVRYADMAMYRAKEGGRGSFRFFKEEMQRAAMARLEREHELLQAMQTHQFRLYYQPIVDLRTDRIAGIEALLRWQHPERGLLLPDEFIALTEETGLIVEIGNWALQEACAEIRKLQDEGQEQLRLSVKMSLRQLHDPGLPEVIENALAQTRLDALWLNIEINERLLREDVLTELDFLNPFGRIGISLTIDNFGSAGSSMNLLASLPVAIIKIDHKLVARLPDDQSARDITLAMIAMARQLGVKVVAAGVETQRQRNFLAASGCDYAQGFWFHRPQPLSDLAELLRRSPAELAAS